MKQGVLWVLNFQGYDWVVLAAVIVVILLVAFPAYRWFFLISFGIGLAVWEFSTSGIVSGQSKKKTFKTQSVHWA